MVKKSVKGISKKVDPITELKDVKTIKKCLSDKPRDLCLFTIGINTNLRASDLTRITVGMVKDLKPGEELVLVEKKTKKERRITLNNDCVDAIQNLIQSFKGIRKDNSQLFRGREGDIKPIGVNYLVNKWVKMINLKGKYGSHSLRKTFGYHMRVQHKVSIPILMQIFNHHSQKQTLDYLCVQPDEIKEVYMLGVG
jgi:site-specific recombinase XerD